MFLHARCIPHHNWIRQVSASVWLYSTPLLKPASLIYMVGFEGGANISKYFPVVPCKAASEVSKIRDLYERGWLL